MATITLKCACGATSQVPDSSVGARLRCRKCGSVSTIRGGAASASVTGGVITKICVVCNANVANQPRTKDQRGRYYCQPCWNETVRAGRAAGTQSVTPDRQSDEPEPLDYACSVCDIVGSADDVYETDGKIVCKTCWQAESGEAVPNIDDFIEPD